MPLYPVNFPVLSPQQANPFGFGMQQGAQTMGAMQDARMKAAQAGLLNAQLPYAGQMQQADLAMKQAQVPYVQSQTAMNTASLPFMGYKFMAPMIAAQANLAKAGVMNQNSYMNLMKMPGIQQLIQQRSDLAQALIQAAQNSAGMINGGVGFPGGGAMGASASSMQPPQTANNNYTNPSASPQLPVQNTGLPGQPINAQQQAQLRNLLQPESPQSSQINSDVQAVQQGTQNAYLKSNLSSQQRNQITYENVADGLLKDNKDVINDAAQFAGLAGKANQTASKYAQSAGVGNSSQYRNFQLFTHQIAPTLANELRRSLGGQATDAENRAMNDIANPIAWDKDPQQVYGEMNQIVSNLKTNSREIVKTPVQAISTLQQNAANPTSFGVKKLDASMLTPDALASTAKKYNMTVAQVQQMLQQHGAM